MFKIIYKLSRIHKIGSILLRLFYGCDIPCDCKIEDGVTFSHNGLGVVIHPKSKIGKNVWIEHHVCLGQKTAKCEATVIEDDVVIGAYAIILGNSHIGKRSVIGAGSIVTHDIPDNSIYYNNLNETIKVNEKRTGQY